MILPNAEIEKRTGRKKRNGYLKRKKIKKHN
jgi:hypothetical protein